MSIHERRAQTEKLIAIAGDEPVPTIMMGDFNDWFWVGSVRKALSRELPGRTRFRTFPSICPLLRLDRIYCRPRGAFVDCYTDRSARAISDHLPVTIMMGDFNDWCWVGSMRKAQSRQLPGRTHFRTFPSIGQMMRRERFYCRPRGAFVDCYTDRSARAVSDHLPVIADIALNARIKRRRPLEAAFLRLASRTRQTSSTATILSVRGSTMMISSS